MNQSRIKVRQEGKRVKVEKGRKREIDKEEQRMNVTNITTGSMWEQPAPLREHACAPDTVGFHSRERCDANRSIHMLKPTAIS